MTTQSPIEVDPVLLENDYSDYESSGIDTSTTSLSSSVNEYITENGRQYHSYYGTDKNLLPEDEIEHERLDMYHQIAVSLLRGKLHKAPIEDPQRILDIGTGTGIWAIDIADEYPMAQVLGTDLSPNQPKWVPPNCRFEVDDAELEWLYKPDFFDFIHSRNISQGIKDWPKLMSQMFRCTMPGGYVELVESGTEGFCDDRTMAEDNGAKRHFDLQIKAMTEIGRAPVTEAILRKRVEDAGFEDVHSFTYKQPLGPWPKDKALKHIGAMILMNCESGFSSYGMAIFTRVLGMRQEQAEKVCSDALAAVRNKNVHIYNHFYVVYGRKPDPTI